MIFIDYRILLIILVGLVGDGLHYGSVYAAELSDAQHVLCIETIQNNTDDEFELLVFSNKQRRIEQDSLYSPTLGNDGDRLTNPLLELTIYPRSDSLIALNMSLAHDKTGRLYPSQRVYMHNKRDKVVTSILSQQNPIDVSYYELPPLSCLIVANIACYLGSREQLAMDVHQFERAEHKGKKGYWVEVEYKW